MNASVPVTTVTKPKVAIVCDWLTNLGGAERVILEMHQLFPEAPIYTSVYNPNKLPQFANAKVVTSWLQKLPGANRFHQALLPFLPRVFESFDFSEYDIVLSSSFACSKGIITNESTLHICYCHNPTRYFWDEHREFFARYQWPKIFKQLGYRFLHSLRQWDYLAAQRPDLYIANSQFVQKRIQKYYQRESVVIHPGVTLAPYQKLPRQDFFLAVGRLTAQKYFDLIVQTFNELRIPLKIVGTGGMLQDLKKMNQSINTEFCGFVSDEKLLELYRSARGFLFPQREDFGVVAIEAQSQGCPVIAFNEGGAQETVLATDSSGVLFNEQTVAGLTKGVKAFLDHTHSDYAAIVDHAQQFSAEAFQNKLSDFITDSWQKFCASR